MHLLIVDHSPGVLLEHDVSALDEAQKSAIDMHPFRLVLDRLLQNLIDVVPMGFQEVPIFNEGWPPKVVMYSPASAAWLIASFACWRIQATIGIRACPKTISE